MDNKTPRFLSALKDLTRRHAYLMALIGAIMLLVTPYIGLTQVRHIAEMLSFGKHTAQEMTKQLTNNLLSIAWVSAAAAAFLGGIAALVLFRHLGDRKTTQFVNALPITRRSAYISRVVAGLTLTMVPILANQLLLALVIAQQGVWAYLDVKFFLSICVTVLLSGVYGFAVGALAYTLTGRIWATLIAAVVIAFGVEVTALMSTTCANIYLKSMPVDMLVQPIVFSSPLLNAMVMRFLVGQTYTGVWYAPLVAAIVLLLLAYFAYVKRRTEASGNTLAFAWTRRPLTIWVTVIGALAFGMFSGAMFMSEFAMYFGVVMGGLVAHIVCQICFTQTLSSALKRKVEYALVVSALVVIALLLRVDAFNYDGYLPITANMRSVTIEVPYNYGDTTTFTLTEPENVENAVHYAQGLRENLLSNRDGAFKVGMISGTNVLVTYTLTNGRTVSRVYPQYGTESLAARDMIDSREYVVSSNPIPALIEQENLEVWVEGAPNVKGDNAIKLLAAYEQDRLNRTYDSGLSRVVTSMYVTDNAHLTRSMFVLSCDVNTIEVLKNLPGYTGDYAHKQYQYDAAVYCALAVKYLGEDSAATAYISKPLQKSAAHVRLITEQGELTAALDASYDANYNACWYVNNENSGALMIFAIDSLPEPFRTQILSGNADQVDANALYETDMMSIESALLIRADRVEAVVKTTRGTTDTAVNPS